MERSLLFGRQNKFKQHGGLSVLQTRNDTFLRSKMKRFAGKELIKLCPGMVTAARDKRNKKRNGNKGQVHPIQQATEFNQRLSATAFKTK